MIRQRGFASLPALAEALEVSESTVRRDLDFLEESGVAQRTHGGVFYTGPSPKLAHFDQRQSLKWDKKRQIAVAASRLIEDNDTILLDGGSTTYELAQLLVGRPLQVVTNSLPVANLFTSSENADLVLVGGYVHAKTGVSLGPYANQMLAGLNVRRAVLSVAGINERGLLQQQPAVGRNRAGDDDQRRRGDRRGRQHEVWPHEPVAAVRAEGDRRAGDGSRDRGRVAGASCSGGVRVKSELP